MHFNFLRKISQHKKAVNIALIVLMLSIVLISRYPMIGPTADKVWWNLDDSEYINVANNLRHGNGFALNILEYNQVITNTPDGSINRYSLYDNIGRPYSFAGPVYPLFLSVVFSISSASPPNWYLVAAVANIVITMLLVVAVFVLARSLFDRNIAILSSIVTALLPSLYWYSLRPLPYPLFFLFVVLAFIVASRASGPKGWFLVGILAALAHLTHSSGLLVIVTFFVWCLISKRFKESLFAAIGYIILMLPWMIRNQLLLGDFGLGLAIPGKALMGLIEPSILPSSSPSVLHSSVPVNTAPSFNVLNLFLHIPSELSSLYSMLVLAVFLLVFSISAFFIYKKKAKIFPQVLYLIFSFLGYIYLGFTLNSVTVETKYLMPAFLVLIPLSMYGFNRFVSMLSMKLRLRGRSQILVHASAVVVLLAMIMVSLFSFSVNLNNNYNFPNAETSEQMQFHAWVREQNLPSETAVLTNAPHVLFLRTGLTSMYLDLVNTNSTQINWLIDRYAINYIVIYNYHLIGANSLTELNEDFNTGNISIAYSSQTIRCYQINRFPN
jgi:hypothetical protein